jgi:hypothetical protein
MRDLPRTATVFGAAQRRERVGERAGARAATMQTLSRLCVRLHAPGSADDPFQSMADRRRPS